MYGLFFSFQHALKMFPQEEERKAKVSSCFDAISIIDPVLTLVLYAT
jgi:hypothetical protein